MNKNIGLTCSKFIGLILTKSKTFCRKNYATTTTKAIHVLVVVSFLFPHHGGLAPINGASLVNNSKENLESSDSIISPPEITESPSVSIAPRPTINRPVPRVGIRPTDNQELQSINLNSGTGTRHPASDEVTDPTTGIYVQNVGQFDSRVLFEIKGTQGTIRLAEDGIWVTLLDADSINPELQQTYYDFERADGRNPDHIESSLTVSGVHMRLQLDGANFASSLEGFDKINTVVSYLYGNDPAMWRPNVPVYAGVRYSNIYPGVDLELRGDAGQWIWSFIIQDNDRFNAEVGDALKNGIRLYVEGTDRLSADNGEYYAQTSLGDFKLPKLEVVNGDKRLQLDALESQDNELVFPPLTGIEESITAQEMTASGNSSNLPSADSMSSPPVFLQSTGSLIYSTYLGGSGGEYATSIAVDSSFAAYITGYSASTNFPTYAGAFQETLAGGCDAFVSKLNAAGSNLIYSTYIGGSADDFAWEIAVDGGNNAYIVGRGNSTDYPVTIGTSDGGAFVTKLNTDGTGLEYSRYVGGSGGEQGFSIAVSPIGQAYIVGQTYSIDFPVTQGAYDTTFNSGYWDGFVAKLDTSGQIAYATYIGGSGGDCETGGDYKECTIAIDITGAAYVTGPTYSSDFPVKGDAIDSTNDGVQDGFVLKLNPQGSDLIYSTYFGGSNNECNQTCKIAITASGEAFVAGSAGSGTTWQVFLAKFSSNGSILESYSVTGMEMGRNIVGGAAGEVYVIGETTPSPYRDAQISKVINTTMYTTYLGGTNDEIGYGIALDKSGATYITGYTNSGDFPATPEAFQTTGGFIDAYVTKIAQDAYTIIDEVGSSPFCGGRKGPGDGRDCPVPAEQSQGTIGDPINTRNGDFVIAYTDITIETPAGSMVFERSYSSLSVDRFANLLGYGWTHNHDTRLIFSSDPGGEADTVLFKSHTTNLHKFIDNGDDTFTAYPGVLSSLIKNPGTPATYTLTDSIQRVYDFDEDGKLTHWRDAQGFGWTYSYDGNGLLDRVTDDTTQRYIDLDYDLQGRIERVIDHTGREIAFGYNIDGDLETFVDVLDKTWTYTYDDEHHLRLVTDPAYKAIVHTEYDEQERAYQQYSPDGTLVLELLYNIDNTTVLTDALGNQKTDYYDQRKTYVNQISGEDELTGRTYDYNFRPTSISDENGNGTQLLWSADGANLTRMIDAYGAQTDLSYDDRNNLISVIDPRGFLTTYTYDDALLVSSTDAYFNTTVYTYTTSTDAPQPPGLFKIVQDPGGYLTQYTYDEYGQRIAMMDRQGLVTEYAYDDLGRLIKISLPTGISNWTCYDETGRIVRTVGNASGDGSTPQSDPCDVTNYQPITDPNYDRISTTSYDDSGNVIATTDPTGMIVRTYFDDNNRPYLSVQNLYGQSIETTTPPDYDPDDPNHNMRSETVYDDAGNVIATIDTLGRITRTYYDTRHRPQYTVQNLVGQAIEASTPPLYDPQHPDQNVRTETVYDAAGNAIATIDILGRITRTYYDALNRSRYIVQNLVGQATEVSTPPAYNPQYPDRNVRMETVYDEAGNPIARIDTLGRIMRTYYDALNRTGTVVQNLSGQAIEIDTPPIFNPSYPDQNVRTDYVYDESSNLIATIDPNGIVNRTYYDAYGRSYLIVSNLYGQVIEDPSPPSFNPTYPDRNVRTETIYDAAGYVIATIDTLGKVSRTYYDELYRPIIVVNNLVGETIEYPTPPTYDPLHPDQNVRAETVYDADGKVIARINNDGKITRTYYDALDRPFIVVRNLYGQTIEVSTPPAFDPNYPDRNVRTETIYGPGGYIARTLDTNGKVTHTCYDGMYRVVETVTNPTIDDPCVSYTPSNDSDKDIVVSTIYNGIGNRLATTDPTGKTTTYEYDALNRLTAEIDPLQHRTNYSYDGNGNRTAFIDAKNIVTRYEYDGLYRLTAVMENYRQGITPNQEINVRTEYTYDAIGNRLTIKDALNHVTTFDYDDLGRLTGESDPLTNSTTYTYDGAGNQVAVLDANGNTISYLYDGLYRPIAIDYPEPEGDVHFTYDSAGNRTVMTDTLGVTTWAYDELNRPVSVTDPFNDTIGYTYDGLGNRTSLIYPDEGAVTYMYDTIGRLDSVTAWDELITSYIYDKSGREQTTILPNGVITSYEYNDSGQLIDLIHSRGEETLASYHYQYDEVGNRTTVTEMVMQPTESPPDLIFGDGFESGGLSSWGASLTDGGDLAAIPEAAIIGSYGLQAQIDDNNNLYVDDWNPASETRYRARFYFDPNSIQMAENNAFYIFQASSGQTNAILIEMRTYLWEYQIRILGSNDSGGLTTSAWFPISDQFHSIELDWRASSGPGANNGGLTLWIDGTQQVNYTNIDNDTRRIDFIRMGAVSGVDNGTRGSIYFDAFESHHQDYIGPDPNAPNPPSPPDSLFVDGFEAGNLSSWSSSATDAGDLSVAEAAAIIGTYGLQAVLDDNANIYVTDGKPFEETHYRARFYFDPNSIPMAHGEGFTLLQAYNRNGTGHVLIETRFSAGDYQVRAGLFNDVNSWTYSPWFTLTDGPHSLELDWRAATAPGANNGELTFWVDDVQQTSFTNIDNDTRRIDYVSFGAVAGVDNNTRGTIYFDAFESRRESYIGLAPGAPEPPSFPEKTDALFADGFESGNFAAWSASATDAGDLSVTAGAVITGTYGLQAVLDDNAGIYVTDWNPFEETRYRARFYFDPNSIPMANGDTHKIFLAMNRDNTHQVIIEFRFIVGDYQARAGIVNDSNGWTWSPCFAITDGPHALELNWKAATAPGANNGELTFWLDDVQQASFTNIDNDTRRIDYVQWGAVADIDNGTRGTYYFDAFESRRETYTGLAPGAPEPPPFPEKTDALFADGFESGNFTAWSASATDAGDLSVTAGAAITGTYGLQAVLDDNAGIYVTDWRPYEETRYRARFYFDPNSIPMASGDIHKIFLAMNRDNAHQAAIEFRFIVGDYQVRGGAVNDSGGWTWSPWFAITDGPHALELDWRAATAVGANNGGLTFWLDDVQQASYANIDNDTRRIDYVQWGAVADIDNGTRGTYYFDAFESRRETYIGLAPGAPEPPPFPEKTDALFADGFESGNFTAWSASATDAGDLSVTAGAAITGTYGLQAVLDDNAGIYVTDWQPFEETRYRARFYFDPNSIPMANGDTHRIFLAMNRDNAHQAAIEFRFIVGDYQVRAGAVNDSGGWSWSSWFAITDGPHALELNWKAATAPGANNGELTFWIDDVQQASFTNLDNDTRRIDYVQWGVVADVDNGTRGTYYFDAFESRRESYIGLIPGAPEPPLFPEKTDALFADGFESGNFTAWSASATDAGDLSVTAGAALDGSYGMAALLDDNNSIYVTDWRPFEETTYRARFYLDPNSTPMTSGNAHYLLYALDRNNTVLLRVEFRYYASQYQLRAEAVNDSGGWSQTAWAAISDAPHFVEVAWQAASAPGANDGALTFWVDDSQQGSFANIDNDTRRIDYAQFGIVGGVDNGSRGTLYFDAFESRRDTYIGPLAELLLFKLALQEAAYRAGCLLLPAWQVVENMAKAAQVVWSEFVSRFETAETAYPEAAPLPIDEGAVLQLTGVLAPVTLQTSTASIKLLAAPEPVREDQAVARPAPLQTAGYTTTRVIAYTYDPLYRLTRADYDDGTYFRYTYDAIGNRLTEETTGATVNTYTYDIANRLISVDGVPYSWDDNGNLLSDGVHTYTYDSANRLVEVSGPEGTTSYAYNGQGDRVSQTVGITNTNYTLDTSTSLGAGLASGLTQVLDDGTYSYLYGAGRVAQYNATGAQYFLGDALGSLRQVVDSSGEVLLAKSYQPYGEVLISAGEGDSSYGFTGEWTESYIELVNLRSRTYYPGIGRFLTRDSWRGDYTRPLSLNGWNYVEANPINFVDPSGYLKETEERDADLIINELKNTYSVLIRKDYGWGPNNIQGYGLCGNKWYEGAWKSLDELKWTKQAVINTVTEMGGGSRSRGESIFKAAMQNKVTVIRWDVTARSIPRHGPITSFAPPAGQIFGDVILPNYTFLHGKEYAKYSIVHELGHVWDRRTSLRLSNELMLYMGTLVCQGMGGCYFEIRAGRELPPGDMDLDKVYAGVSPMEDWAEAFASTVYRTYWGPGYRKIGPLREKFVRDQIAALP